MKPLTEEQKKIVCLPKPKNYQSSVISERFFKTLEQRGNYHEIYYYIQRALFNNANDERIRLCDIGLRVSNREGDP